jgi:hypothetical protein
MTDDRGCLALLIVIQLMVTAVVQPRGDFPQNDDWAYAHMASSLPFPPQRSLSASSSDLLE